MAEKPSFRRTQYLVNRGYQLRFVFWLLTVLVMAMFVSLVAASLVLTAQLNRPELGSDSCLPSVMIGVTLFCAIQILLLGPIFFVFGILQTHRVVGPIHRIKRMLERIGEGDFSARITLRKGDVLSDLTDAINAMAENLQKRSAKP